MKRSVTIEKKVGETPLEAMEQWRLEAGLAKNIPLAYAGRLDPMASGKLLVLIGDECKQQEKYHAFDKEYQFEILFGFRSDTGDTLGLAERAAQIQNNNEVSLKRALGAMHGAHQFCYPRFSAKTVRGIPLHEWTLRGGLRDDEIPTYTATVKRIAFNSLRTIDAATLLADIKNKIAQIPPVTDPRKSLGNDFRRSDILPLWDQLLIDQSAQYQIASCTTTVSSGTYIRTLAPEIAAHLGTYGLAYSIHRTHVGRYIPLSAAVGFWLRSL